MLLTCGVEAAVGRLYSSLHPNANGVVEQQDWVNAFMIQPGVHQGPYKDNDVNGNDKSRSELDVWTDARLRGYCLATLKAKFSVESGNNTEVAPAFTLSLTPRNPSSTHLQLPPWPSPNAPAPSTSASPSQIVCLLLHFTSDVGARYHEWHKLQSGYLKITSRVQG